MKSTSTLVASIFQSTSPTRGDDNHQGDAGHGVHISIHVPYERGRQVRVRHRIECECISIHVPYERGRQERGKKADGLIEFQSTSPTRGDDRPGAYPANATSRFQSTSPTRGDDAQRRHRRLPPCNFNPRPLREGTTARYCMHNSVSHNTCKYCISCAPNCVLTCGQCNAESTFQGANLMCKSVIAICSHTQF